jgi:hypothetical protein
MALNCELLRLQLIRILASQIAAIRVSAGFRLFFDYRVAMYDQECFACNFQLKPGCAEQFAQTTRLRGDARPRGPRASAAHCTAPVCTLVSRE